MEFIQIILQNSNLREAKLYGAAHKAALNPEIGITIQNKAAYHVIKDCANITMRYLPHLVFGSYQNPFESLKGKFKREILAEFIKQSETDLSLNQLFHIIVAKAEKMNIAPASLQVPAESIKFDIKDLGTNPYGEYDLEQPVAKQSTDVILSPLDILCKIFSV